MILGEMLTVERVFPNLRPSGKQSLLRTIIGRLAEAGDVTDADAVLQAVVERENLTSTGIGAGYAIPHTFCSQVNHYLLALATIPQGTDFKSLDGQPVRFVFLLLGPPAAQAQHLKILARLCRILNDKTLFTELAAAQDDAERLCQIIRARESAYEAKYETANQGV
jgi:mannitol/fructose-specific phosphotransferase system IIA component (Ntr-type)